MSGSAYSSYFQKGTSFEEERRSQMAPESDSSYNTPTVSSLETLSTTHSLIASENSAMVNHFESLIVFRICRAMEKEVEVPAEFIYKEVDKVDPQLISWRIR